MQSFGSIIIATVIVAAAIAGGTYFLSNQKMSEQKKEFSTQIKELEDKTKNLEESTSKVNSQLEEQKKQQTAATSQTTEPAAQTPASTSATAATSPDITNWKTFESTRYYYSVKYPADWDYKDNTAGTAMNSIGFKPKTVKDTYSFNVVVEKSTLDYSIGLIKKQLAASSNFKSQATADINGKTFATLNFEDKTGGLKPVVYLIAKDDLVYHFTANNSTDATANANITEIIKSFTFTK